MEGRAGYAPMDFEYDNGVGQTPADSPWPKKDPNKPFSFAAPEPQKSQFRQNPSFAAPSMKLPQTPSKLPPAWREPDTGFSTDNQSSPENADSEATPDVPPTKQHLRKLDEHKVSIARGGRASPSKQQQQLKKATSSGSSRRESILDGMETVGNMFLFGPTQLVARHAAADSPLSSHRNRRRKRSRREFDHDNNQIYSRHGGRDSDYADWDDSPPPRRTRGASPSGPASKVHEMGTLPAALAFIHQHPQLPHILSYYGQMALSWGLVALFFYAIWVVARAVGHEVDLAAAAKASEILRENGECLSKYQMNRCGPDAATPPALRAQCREWEDCFNRDSKAVGRGSISAATFAGILNQFVEPLSWKLISTVVFVVLMLVSIPRALFGFLSKKHEAQMQPAYPPPPQFPSGQYMQSPYQTGYQPGPQDVYYTPRHQRYGDGFDREREMSPSKRNGSPSKSRHESPSKRIGYL